MSSVGDRRPLFVSGASESGQTLDIDAFTAAYGGVTTSRLKAGTVIYRQGEPADAMCYVQDGRVQITVVSSRGKEGILGVLDPGSFFGEGSLLENRTRAATATCLVDSIIVRLERSNMVRALRESPAVAEFLAIFALKALVRVRESLISQFFDSSETRLARALLILANYGSEGRAQIIRNVDQEALAQMIGTTRSRVNHFMNKFRRLHHIDYDGNAILVHGSLSDVAFSDAGDDSSHIEEAI